MKARYIDAVAVSKKFQLSVRSMRDYKRLGIIQPEKCIGNKDYYDLSEIVRAVRIVDEMSTSDLSEIAEVVKKDRSSNRKKQNKWRKL